MNKNYRENLKERNKDKKVDFKKPKRLDIKVFNVKKKSELLTYLTTDLGFGRNKAKALLSHHLVSINGAPISQYNFLVYPKDELIIAKSPIRKRVSQKIPIIYEDEEFIVINKPYGLLAVPSDNEKGVTAFRMVMDHLQEKDKHQRIFIVHRIDKETSGILMFCKNEKIKDLLADQWNDIVSKRGYFAVIEGRLKEKSGTITNYLKKNKENMMYVVKHADKETRRAVTEYKVIKENEDFSLLDINLKTGRKNQIRVAFGNLGHFVVGEDKYGEPVNPLKRLCLHNYELEFTHPITGKKYDFKTNMPKEFLSLFK